MTARKASAKKKASSKKTSSKKASPKAKAPTRKAASKKKAGAKKPGSKRAAASRPEPSPIAPAQRKAAAKKETSATKSGALSMQVTMGHVFALRPRVITGFRPDDFRRARQLLADEPYANIQAAARSVAERALELTHDGPDGVPKPKRF